MALEIYGALARRFPAQVGGILIRNVTAEDPDGERFARAFADVPRRNQLPEDDYRRLHPDLHPPDVVPPDPTGEPPGINFFSPDDGGGGGGGVATW
jgi:hypothetical protein